VGAAVRTLAYPSLLDDATISSIMLGVKLDTGEPLEPNQPIVNDPFMNDLCGSHTNL
jgi:hypothetical protein